MKAAAWMSRMHASADGAAARSASANCHARLVVEDSDAASQKAPRGVGASSAGRINGTGAGRGACPGLACRGARRSAANAIPPR